MRRCRASADLALTRICPPVRSRAAGPSSPFGNLSLPALATLRLRPLPASVASIALAMLLNRNTGTLVHLRLPKWDAEGATVIY